MGHMANDSGVCGAGGEGTGLEKGEGGSGLGKGVVGWGRC